MATGTDSRAAPAADAPSTTERLAARDGTELLVRHWPASGVPWASVLLLHGVAEHSGRYEHVGRQLAAAGLEVEAYDQRGFGGSGGRRAFVERWSQNHDDLEDRLAAVRASAGNTPVVIFGHSLGALLALGYAVAEPPRPLPDALVLSAPALDSTIPAWKRALARVLSSVAPTKEMNNDFDGALLSRDPAIGEAYVADPLNQHSTTFRFGAAAFAEQARVRAALGRLSVPTFVYHGEDDHLVPTDASAPLAAVPGVRRRTYPLFRHETHNEPEGPAVIADVIAWLRATLPSSEGD
ncbi:MAG TPA: alpha/beta fold hydrolase [Candidatus Limnocylindrales bacterium]|nr:alpha/beta fold hydrolase [Candidatus Limnocylindrales bacterium]